MQVGEDLTPLVQEIGMARMMAYGAATWDFIRVHYDADYVRELEFEGPFVDGQMLGGFRAAGNSAYSESTDGPGWRA